MAYNKLGSVLRENIIKDFKSGKRQAKICKKYNIAKLTVSKTVKSFRSRDWYETNHWGGRPRKTSQKLDRRIVKDLKKYLLFVIHKINRKTTNLRTLRPRDNEAKLFQH